MNGNIGPPTIILHTTISQHRLGDKTYGHWIKLHRALDVLPPRVFPRRSRHVPWGTTRNGSHAIVVLRIPPSGATLPLEELGAIAAKACAPLIGVQWRGRVLLRREDKYSARIYLPKKFRVDRCGKYDTNATVYRLPPSWLVLDVPL